MLIDGAEEATSWDGANVSREVYSTNSEMQDDFVPLAG